MNTTTVATTGVVLPDGQLKLDGAVQLAAGPVRIILETMKYPLGSPWDQLEQSWSDQRARHFVEIANGSGAESTLDRSGQRSLRGLTLEAADLRDCMSQISEDRYCAGWLSGLEFILWDAVMNGPADDGRWIITQSDIDRLRLLARRCGGWIAWDEQLKDTVCVPIQEWLERYRQHLADRQLKLSKGS